MSSQGRGGEPDRFVERRVIFSAEAASDLREIGRRIEEVAPHAARRHVQAIRTFCLGLAVFPERGRSWQAVAPGLRTLSFRGSVTILFQVRLRTVVILALVRSGRDITADLEQLGTDRSE